MSLSTTTAELAATLTKMGYPQPALNAAKIMARAQARELTQARQANHQPGTSTPTPVHPPLTIRRDKTMKISPQDARLYTAFLKTKFALAYNSLPQTWESLTQPEEHRAPVGDPYDPAPPWWAR